MDKTESSNRVDSVSLDMALAIIRNCMTLMSAGEFRESVRTVIKDIIKVSGARSCRIMLLDDENRRAINYCEELAEGLDPAGIPGDGNIPYEVVKMWEKMIGSRDSIIVNGQEELDEISRTSPGLAMMMKRNQTTRIVMLPLRREGEILGFMYVVNFSTDRVDDLKDLVELMSFFLGSEIFNHQLMARLRRMSTEDELTGLHNRNAMMNRINDLVKSDEKGSVGVINMDLNGLKRINDTRGHESGDRYLQHAAGVMKDIFGEADVYRSGGDEFIAIVENTTHEGFSQLLDKLHSMGKKDPEFNLAIGYYWSEDGISDARTAFKAADNSMYSDKRRYYSDHPEFDRRH